MHTKKTKVFPFYAKWKIQNSEQENPVGGRDTSNVIFARPTKSRNEGRLHNNRVGIFGTFPNSEITSVLGSVFYGNDKKYLGLNRKQMWHRSQVSGGVCRGVMGRAISPMGLLSLSLCLPSHSHLINSSGNIPFSPPPPFLKALKKYLMM